MGLDNTSGVKASMRGALVLLDCKRRKQREREDITGNWRKRDHVGVVGFLHYSLIKMKNLPSWAGRVDGAKSLIAIRSAAQRLGMPNELPVVATQS